MTRIPTVFCPKVLTSTGVTITSETPDGGAHLSGVSVDIGEVEGEVEDEEEDEDDEEEEEDEYSGGDEGEEENEGTSHISVPRERLAAGGGRAMRMSGRA